MRRGDDQHGEQDELKAGEQPAVEQREVIGQRELQPDGDDDGNGDRPPVLPWRGT
jgi:hypothetical protein